MKAIVALSFLGLTGCGTLVSLRPEVEHVSHVSQHFGSHPTNYGYDAALVDLHIETAKHLIIDVADGVVLEPEHHFPDGTSYNGGLVGPKEVFQMTVGWDIPLNH